MTPKSLLGSIVLTSGIIMFANITLQEYLIAALAFVFGSAWLLLEIKKKESPHSVFFLFFLVLAILGSLRNLPIPIMLLALSFDLVSWDLSRFQARIRNEVTSDTKNLLEIKHLQNLAITTSIGFLVALIPVFVHISINFVIFLIIILAIMLGLRKSILYLRNEKKSST